MAILNITYAGISADYPLDSAVHLADDDLRRIAIEVVRAGGVRGLRFPDLADNAFDHFVVDRAGAGHGAQRIYLRPKVPFGSIAEATSA